MVSSSNLIHICLVTFIFQTSIFSVAEGTRQSFDIEELAETLFPVHRHPFAQEDRWPLLSREQREAWTFAHDEVTEFVNENLINTIKSFKDHRLSLLITLKIVASQTTKLNQDELTRYARLMHPKGYLNDINFRLMHPKEHLFSQIASASGPQADHQISQLLQHDATSTGASDTLYVILVDKNGNFSNLASHPPFLVGDRAFWYVHLIDEKDNVNVAEMLVRTERVAEKLFDPAPKFFPVPVASTRRIRISAFTPRHDHEAPWAESFPWRTFEKTVRDMALVGQTIGFFLNPDSKDCVKCSDAFHNALKSTTASDSRVLKVWKNEQKDDFESKGEESDTNEVDPKSTSTVFILVVDTMKVPASVATERLEKIGVVSMEGASMVFIRSSQRNAIIRLHSLLLQAIAECAFGISNPGRYIYEDSLVDVPAEGTQKKVSMILLDNVLKNAVSSSIRSALSELETIVWSMKTNDVIATKFLADEEYVTLVQRTNLLFYKIKQSQVALSEQHDGAKALHMATASFHDLRSIQSLFRLSSRKMAYVFAHFADPCTKCGFLKTQERSLTASEVFEERGSVLTSLSIIFAGLSFILGFLLGHGVRLSSRMRYAVKRE